MPGKKLVPDYLVETTPGRKTFSYIKDNQITPLEVSQFNEQAKNELGISGYLLNKDKRALESLVAEKVTKFVKEKHTQQADTSGPSSSSPPETRTPPPPTSGTPPETGVSRTKSEEDTEEDPEDSGERIREHLDMSRLPQKPETASIYDGNDNFVVRDGIVYDKSTEYPISDQAAMADKVFSSYGQEQLNRVLKRDPKLIKKFYDKYAEQLDIMLIKGDISSTEYTAIMDVLTQRRGIAKLSDIKTVLRSVDTTDKSDRRAITI